MTEIKIREIQVEVHALAREKGWYDNGPRNVLEMIALIHSELGELTEAYREDDQINFEEECADVAIRLMDLCEYCGVDLEEQIRIKHKYNQSRPYRHGGKKA